MQSTDDFHQLRTFKKEENEPTSGNFNIFAFVQEEEKKKFEEDQKLVKVQSKGMLEHDITASSIAKNESKNDISEIAIEKKEEVE